MAVNPNVAPNLGTKRRRRGRKSPPGLQRIKARVQPGALDRARAVGLRRRGRAPASDTRRFDRGRPADMAIAPVAPKVDVAARIAKLKGGAVTGVKPTSSAAPSAPATTGAKPPKPAVPAGQPKAFGARRKFGANLPPGLAKRTGSPMPAKTARFKPPKPPKRRGPKGY